MPSQGRSTKQVGESPAIEIALALAEMKGAGKLSQIRWPQGRDSTGRALRAAAQLDPPLVKKFNGGIWALTAAGISASLDRGVYIFEEQVNKRLAKLEDKRDRANLAKEKRRRARSAAISRAAYRSRRKEGLRSGEIQAVIPKIQVFVDLSGDTLEEWNAEAQRLGISKSRMIRLAWGLAAETIKGWPTLSELSVESDPVFEHRPDKEFDLSKRTGVSLENMDDLVEEMLVSENDMEGQREALRLDPKEQRVREVYRAVREVGPSGQVELSNALGISFAQAQNRLVEALKAGALRRLGKGCFDIMGSKLRTAPVRFLPLTDRIERLLKRNVLSIAELAKRLKAENKSVKWAVATLRASGRVERIGEGQYRAVDSGNTR